MQISRRDGDRCCLCGKKGINIHDSTTFEVEHRLPISKGGLDTLANVGLAHPGCNAEKRNGLFRGQPEQLRLVG
jgi:5-methylcytosine-specific restriction endonuclease McrA